MLQIPSLDLLLRHSTDQPENNYYSVTFNWFKRWHYWRKIEIKKLCCKKRCSNSSKQTNLDIKLLSDLPTHDYENYSCRLEIVVKKFTIDGNDGEGGGGWILTPPPLPPVLTKPLSSIPSHLTAADKVRQNRSFLIWSMKLSYQIVIIISNRKNKEIGNQTEGFVSSDVFHWICRSLWRDCPLSVSSWSSVCSQDYFTIQAGMQISRYDLVHLISIYIFDFLQA